VTPLLEVRELQVRYATRQGEARAANGVSFTLARGETLGLLGESGSGKTTVAKALLKLLPPNGRIAGGAIVFDGQDLVPLTEAEMRRVRWRRISMIFQSAMNALDPVYRVGDQIVEAIRLHEPVGRREAKARARELLELVGIEGRRAEAYPHQLSGGMKQRVCIAMALALHPDLIIADEPTTALDVVVKDHILEQIVLLQARLGFSVVYISHDISVVAETCRTVAVMYAGRIVEWGGVRQVFNHPLHPYTMGLQHAFPRLHGAEELVSIPGAPPSLVEPSRGCPFATRCPFVVERCRDEDPRLAAGAQGHLAACHRLEEAPRLRERAGNRETWQATAAAGAGLPG
jgi:oligopeptide/dipeptide ABC transporter ATP-binding protein